MGLAPPKTQWRGKSHPAKSDCIVWANRAGGKTYLAALATLLDCIFREEFHVRILGGSKDQSQMMYAHFTSFLLMGHEDCTDGKRTKSYCRFNNGSTVQILTQSERNVRGQHVQRLRCDELDLFDRDVFNAAKFITESKGVHRGGMELLSTMHRPYGLMQEQVDAASSMGILPMSKTGVSPVSIHGRDAHATNVPIFKWCVWEVIERCKGRNCSRCPLWSDCGGKAKKANGYLAIDDCIDFARRASRAAWECEMLCLRPSLENVVFSEFNADVHVRSIDYDPNLPLYRAIDFGYVNPFVCLWIQVDESGSSCRGRSCLSRSERRPADNDVALEPRVGRTRHDHVIIRVVDEYVKRRSTVSANAKEVIKRTRVLEERVAGTYCDPSGASSNDLDGSSAVKELRSHGIRTRFRKSSIYEGIELIRRHLRSGDGRSSLIISNNCPRLIEAMECYHYPDSPKFPGELPVKDGVYDHPVDALRYFFVNYFKKGKTGSRPY